MRSIPGIPASALLIATLLAACGGRPAVTESAPTTPPAAPTDAPTPAAEAAEQPADDATPAASRPDRATFAFRVLPFDPPAGAAIELTVQRPDGTNWQRRWTELTDAEPVDAAGWHIGPGTYHFAVTTGARTTRLEQTLVRPVIESQLRVGWVPSQRSPEAEALTGVALTTIQTPHPEVDLVWTHPDRHDELRARLGNALDQPIFSIRSSGQFSLAATRWSEEQGEWVAAQTWYVCGTMSDDDLRPAGGAFSQLASGADLELAGGDDNPAVLDRSPPEPGRHRFVLEYALAPASVARSTVEGEPTVVVRTGHRLQTEFDVYPEGPARPPTLSPSTPPSARSAASPRSRR